MILEYIDENQKKVMEEGGIETVIKIIKIHFNNLDLCNNSCCLLSDIIANNRKKKLLN